MREIISLQFGQCGLNVGCKFWRIIAREHNLDELGFHHGDNSLQLERIDTLFTHAHSGKYVPRSILVDLDPGSVEFVTSGDLRELFSPEKSVCGVQGGSNNWAKGFYTDGAELLELVMERIRKEAEPADCLQGFQIIHSMSGGAGAGLSTRVMTRLQEEFSDRIIAPYSILPSPKVSDVVVEPYNATFAIHHLIDASDATFLFDNEAIIKICHQILKIDRPSYGDLNHVLCYAMSGATTCLRFPGQLNADLRKLSVNMIPFPRLHFFMVGYAPLCHSVSMKYRSLNIHDLTQQMFDPKNLMVGCSPRSGKYLTAAAIFRGHVSTKEVDEEMARVQNIRSASFVEWIPQNISTAMCDIAPPGVKLSSTFIANSTSIQDVLKRVAEQFSAMLSRRAFLHWYLGEGMEEEEFSEAESNLHDIINEYEQAGGVEFRFSHS